MGEVVAIGGWIVLAVALVGACYSLGAGAAVAWFFSRPSATESDFPPVTILKPLHSDEPGLRDCLQGFCTQDYPAPVQIVFGVREAADSAIPIVKALAQDNPGLDLDLVIDGRVYGRAGLYASMRRATSRSDRPPSLSGNCSQAVAHMVQTAEEQGGANPA